MRSLSQPRFAAYVSVHSLSQLGTWVQQIVVGWYAWEQTHSEAILGLIAFLQFGPALVLTPIAGVLADGRREGRIVAAADAVSGAAALSLAALAAAQVLSVPALLAGVLLSGIAGSLAQPARQVFVARLVGREALPSAVAVNSVSMNVARSMGPLGAAALIATQQLPWAFLLNGVATIANAAVLWRLAPPDRAPGARAPALAGGGSMFAAALDGLKAAWASPVLRPVLGLYLAYALLGRPVIDMLPAIVGQLLGGTGTLLGQLNSLFGVVAIVAGLLMTWLPARRLLQAEVLSLAWMAVGVAVLVHADGTAGAFAGIAIFAVGQVAVNVSSTTAAQLCSDSALTGRVMALHVLAFRFGAALGGLAVGAVADLVGLWETMVAVAAALLAAFICGGLATRRVRLQV
ncbi:MAG: MFS transporter [Rubrivivax sp.]